MSLAVLETLNFGWYYLKFDVSVGGFVQTHIILFEVDVTVCG